MALGQISGKDVRHCIRRTTEESEIEDGSRSVRVPTGLTLEAWKALGQLQDEGKVRLIGVSNTYDVRILASLGKARKVQVVQNRWYEGNEWDQKVWGPSNLWKRLLSQMCISTRHIRRRVFLLV